MEPLERAPVCERCGWDSGAPAEIGVHLPPGTVLHGKYLIGRVLGEGGFGITYLAWEEVLQQKLAIKEYLPRRIATRAPGQLTVSVSAGTSYEDFQYGLTRFIEEGRAVALFKDEPGIVRVQDCFKENETAYLVMDYIEGMTLSQYVKDQGGRLDWDTVLKLVLPVMDALRTVHAKGLVHRDVSPDNIYVTLDGRIKLLDFGAARFALGQKTQGMSIIVKDGYAPWEQYQSKGKQGAHSDVYALGATLYRLVTGRMPSPALDRVVNDDLISPARLGVKIPSLADSAIMRALSIQSSDRFQTVDDFQRALLGSTPPGPSLSRRAVPPAIPPASFRGEAAGAGPEREIRHPTRRRKELNARDAEREMLPKSPPRKAPAQPKARGGRPRGNVPSRKSGSKRGITVLLIVATFLTLASLAAIRWVKPDTVVAVREWIEVLLTGNVEGEVQVSSNPAGAEIYVDGKPQGVVTPSAVTLAGKRGETVTIEVRLDEYSSGRCQIVRDREMSNCDMVLKSLIRVLEVETKPAGARMTIDGEYKGATPVTIKVNRNDVHKITLTRDSYFPRTVVLQPDEELSKPIVLVGAGAIEVRSSYPVELFIGDKAYGEKDRHYEKVAARTQSITLRARDAFYLSEQQLQIPIGGTIRLETDPLGGIRIGSTTGSVTIDKIAVPRAKHGVVLKIAAGSHTITNEGSRLLSTSFIVEPGTCYQASFYDREILVDDYASSGCIEAIGVSTAPSPNGSQKLELFHAGGRY